jgi:hypothetical protein
MCYHVGAVKIVFSLLGIPDTAYVLALFAEELLRILAFGASGLLLAF